MFILGFAKCRWTEDVIVDMVSGQSEVSTCELTWQPRRGTTVIAFDG